MLPQSSETVECVCIGFMWIRRTVRDILSPSVTALKRADATMNKLSATPVVYVSSILGNWSINSRGHVVLTVYTPCVASLNRHLNTHIGLVLATFLPIRLNLASGREGNTRNGANTHKLHLKHD